MERSRGYRGASNYSSNYSNRSADLQQHRGHRGGSSQSSHKDWSHPQKSYDQNYSSNHGIITIKRTQRFNDFPTEYFNLNHNQGLKGGMSILLKDILLSIKYDIYLAANVESKGLTINL